MSSTHLNNHPDSFVYLKDIIADIQLDMRYYGNNNFLGNRVDGYQQPVCLITKAAALALKNVQKELNAFGLGLKVFDAYRPQMAVDQFVRWADDPNDNKNKAEYFPDLEKQRLVADGYIARQSSHSRGSTADLTIIDRTTLEELDMGTPFDFFSSRSWPDNLSITSAQRANRMLLQQIMHKHGFSPLKEEWWHFTLKSEPHPDQYFNFPVQ